MNTDGMKPANLTNPFFSAEQTVRDYGSYVQIKCSIDGSHRKKNIVTILELMTFLETLTSLSFMSDDSNAFLLLVEFYTV